MNNKNIFRAPSPIAADPVKIKFGNTITKIVAANDQYFWRGYYQYISNLVFPNSIKEINIDGINIVDNWAGLTSITVGDEATRDLVNSSTCLGQVVPVSQWIIDPSINAKQEDPTKIPLTFTAEEANSTLKIQQNGSAPTLNLEYNLNDSGWMTYTQGNTITLANVGDKVQMRATEAGNATFSSSTSNYNRFVMTGKIAASGNIQSVLDQTMSKTNVMSYCYYSMFYDCTSLTQAPELPATELAGFCYYNMFYDCTSLTQAPELPATTLADSCYGFMFSYCKSLTKAPELPAKTLAKNCYFYMFEGCTSLTQAPELPATTLADSCYECMFHNIGHDITINANIAAKDYIYAIVEGKSGFPVWVVTINFSDGTFIKIVVNQSESGGGSN